LTGDPPEGPAARATDRRRIGALVPRTVRGKLFLVFSIIVVSAGIGATVAQRANVLVQTQLALITEDNLPSLVTAHRISEATTNIRNVAVALATSESEAALASRRELLARHIDTAKAVVIALGDTGIDPRTASDLRSRMAEVEELGARLAETVGARLKLAGEVTSAVQALANDHLAFVDAIRPLLAREMAFLDSTRGRVIGDTRETVDRLNEISFKGLIPVLNIGAQVAKMKEALRSGETAPTVERRDLAWGEFVAASAVIGRNMDVLGASPAVAAILDVEELGERFRRLLALGTGDDSVFERRRREGPEAKPVAIPAATEVDQSFREFERLLQLSVTLIRGETVTAGIDLNRKVADSLSAMNKASIDGHGALLGLEALGNRAVGILTVAPFAGKLEDLEPLRRELRATHDEFAAVIGRMNRGEHAMRALEIGQRLMEYGRGDHGILELRAHELRAQEAVDDLLSRANALTRRMSHVAADIVAVAQQRAESAAAEVVESLHDSRLTLSLALGFSLLAILGAVVYVNRSLGSRLGAFSNAALALAEGNLRVKLPEPSGHDELTRLMRALAVFRDTAAEMEASNLREIALMRQRLIDAIESISEGFAFFDAGERLVIANSRYRDVFLRGVRDLIVPGATFETIVRAAVERGLILDRDHDPEAWLALRLDKFRRSRGPFTLEYVDGTFVQINERKTADGGTVVVYSDVTDLKQREIQLTHAKEQAEAANEAKSSFLANVSHELRTPLTSILGFARIVQKRFASAVLPRIGNADEQVARAVGQIERNLGIILLEGERLTKLVNEVLDLEKIEAGEMVWNVTELDVSQLVDRAASATESLYRQKGLDFVAVVEPGLPRMLGDADRVVQVLINLISNAVKSTDAGRITCQASADPAGCVRVSVTDTGRGIAAEDHAAIFEKFRQVGDTLTDKPSGTGLGLPICREIIEHLGGEIAVDSDLGTGSTFTFWLPAARSAEVSADSR